ncbi:MAG: N-acetylmuramoyl-L-alanine amidase [Bacteroidales bacterium]|nr:N-acetylmuramoyl-L-alanine amidase [Bacteroidales bacterium]
MYFITKKIIQKRYHKQFLLLFVFNLFLFSVGYSQINERYSIKTIVIDAGHGGKDPGTSGRKNKEKDIALAIALKLGTYIEENIPEVKVIYTRTKDVFITLNERSDIANRNKADLFISIHVDGWHDSKVYGTSTHVMGLHKTEQNLELAKKENSVILLEEDYTNKYEGFDPTSSESYIIFSFLQNTFLEQSLNYASFVEHEFETRALRKSRGVKQAGFLVLWKTTMPSVLIETGFLTNPREERYLSSNDGQEYIASAIYRALKNYKKTIEEKSAFVAKIDSSQIISGSDLILFKVQIASSGNSISKESDFFKGFEDVEEFKINNAFKYTIGSAADFEKIVAYKKIIAEKFPDAFIIAVDKSGKIIPLNEALKLINN